MQIKIEKNIGLANEIFKQAIHSIYSKEEQFLKQSENISASNFYCFLYIQHTQIDACCSIYVNSYLNVCCIGNYECINNDVTCEFFWKNLIKYCVAHGFIKLLGPMNGSTWENYRYKTTENTNPFFLEYYHKPYYVNQWIKNGFTIIENYITQKDSDMRLLNDSYIARCKSLYKHLNIQIRTMDLENYELEIEKLFDFCTETFADNVYYSPIDKSHFIKKYMPLKKYINPNHVLVAELNNKFVSLYFAIDNYLDKTQKGLVVKTIARKKQREYAGIMHVLTNLGTQYAVENNYDYMLHAYMHNSNTSVNVSKKYGGLLYNEYILMQKML